eukprot:1395353-Amorphochlora_amoeboformis.AAC.6
MDKRRRPTHTGREITQDIAMLIMSAGQATPGYFLDQDIDQFKRHMNLNYFGSLHSVKVCGPRPLRRAADGVQAFSQNPKRNPNPSPNPNINFKGFGVNVSIAYPPDTRSPGFDRENLTKPEECKSKPRLNCVFLGEKDNIPLHA